MTDYFSSYFLGANTNQGFYSCYDTFCDTEQTDFLWVIKGGPGCGKSTFMKLVAAAAEAQALDVEYVLCSADPDSVDGIYIPQWHVGYVDGTAPHVQEVRVPGAGGAYLDLGQYYDFSALRCKRAAIVENQRQYRALYADIYAKLSVFKHQNRAQNHSSKARFYRAITHKGCLSLYPRRCDVIGMDTANELAEDALSHQKRLIEIRHPLFPELVEGIYLPDTHELYRMIHTEEDLALEHAISIVCPLLKQAKAMHDELEAIYHPHVDFDGVTAMAEKHIKMLKNQNTDCKYEENIV